MPATVRDHQRSTLRSKGTKFQKKVGKKGVISDFLMFRSNPYILIRALISVSRFELEMLFLISMAIGGDLGGPKVGRFLWIMKSNVPRLGSEIGQAQSKMGRKGSS